MLAGFEAQYGVGFILMVTGVMAVAPSAIINLFIPVRVSDDSNQADQVVTPME